MDTLLIIGLGILVWILICVVVVAVCKAASRGDEDMRDDDLLNRAMGSCERPRASSPAGARLMPRRLA